MAYLFVVIVGDILTNVVGICYFCLHVKTVSCFGR